MKILLPPYMRIIAVALCIFSLTPWVFDLDKGLLFLEKKEHTVSKVLFCAGLLLLALAGKRENKQRWLGARKKALGETLAWLIVFIPVMAFVNKHEDGSLDWISLTGGIFAGLFFFIFMATFHFYNDKKIAIAE